MAAKTFAIHSQEDLIRRVDKHAERMRRSRNFLINQGIELLLIELDGELDGEHRKSQNAKYKNKKAGTQ